MQNDPQSYLICYVSSLKLESTLVTKVQKFQKYEAYNFSFCFNNFELPSQSLARSNFVGSRLKTLTN